MDFCSLFTRQIIVGQKRTNISKRMKIWSLFFLILFDFYEQKCKRPRNKNQKENRFIPAIKRLQRSTVQTDWFWRINSKRVCSFDWWLIFWPLMPIPSFPFYTNPFWFLTFDFFNSSLFRNHFTNRILTLQCWFCTYKTRKIVHNSWCWW